jgi:hypothetical protein
VVAPGLSDAGLAEVGGSEQVVIAIGGGAGALDSTGEGFLARLAADLVDLDVVTVAAEGSDPTSTFLTTTLDRAGSATLVTVDGLDHEIGVYALVLGIDAVTLSGEGGSWGIGDQASEPLPPPG